MAATYISSTYTLTKNKTTKCYIFYNTNINISTYGGINFSYTDYMRTSVKKTLYTEKIADGRISYDYSYTSSVHYAGEYYTRYYTSRVISITSIYTNIMNTFFTDWRETYHSNKSNNDRTVYTDHNIVYTYNAFALYSINTTSMYNQYTFSKYSITESLYTWQ